MRLLAALPLLALAAACSKPASAPPPAPTPAAAQPADLPAGHPPLAAPKLPAEIEAKAQALAEDLKKQPAAFAPAAALGDLFYDHARYPDAVDAYREAGERAKGALALLDELRAAAPAKVPAAAEAGCPDASPAALAPNAEKARALREKGQPGPALACARQAAAPALAALARRANALFLIGNVDPALAEYDRVLVRDPDLPEALFFHGALLLNRRGAGPADLGRAQKLWGRFLEVAPQDHPRRAEVQATLPKIAQALAAPAAPAAGAAAAAAAGAEGMPPGHPPMPGAEGMPAGHPPMPGAEMPAGHPPMEGGAAPAPADLDGALDQAEAALAKGDVAAASRLYMGAMQSRPQDARVQAGLAAAQFLKGSAMAERVFAVAVATDAKAVDDLAERIRAKGNPGLARTLLQRLAAAAPEYAAKAKVKERAK